MQLLLCLLVRLRPVSPALFIAPTPGRRPTLTVLQHGPVSSMGLLAALGSAPSLSRVGPDPKSFNALYLEAP
jgi:hypothetical protein